MIVKAMTLFPLALVIAFARAHTTPSPSVTATYYYSTPSIIFNHLHALIARRPENTLPEGGHKGGSFA